MFTEKACFNNNVLYTSYDKIMRHNTFSILHSSFFI